MDLLKVTILSVVSIIVLFILTKIMGNREMSQLTMFDYIVSITIGSIAAEMATALESSFMQPLIAMVVYAAVTVIISYLSMKSIKIRRVITGTSLILLDNGILYRKNFKKAKLDINEFLMECRNNGYFNLSDIQTAILEANGKISFLPDSTKRPATPEDLNIDNAQEELVRNVVLDGQLLTENLKATGNSQEWFLKKMHSQGIRKLEDIFLATCDQYNNVSIYTKKTIGNSHDSFE